MAMKKILIASAVAALSCAIPALAGGPLGVSGGARGNAGVGVGAAGVGANVNAGANADVNGSMGGTRAPNATAAENSNGRFAADRDFGRDRAEDRMSDEGRKHQRSGSSHANKRGDREPKGRQFGAEGAASAATDANVRTR
jgi:hypothetical protein